jgi:hypothetical protein
LENKIVWNLEVMAGMMPTVVTRNSGYAKNLQLPVPTSDSQVLSAALIALVSLLNDRILPILMSYLSS